MLGDLDEEVFDLYAEGSARPQYIVFDRGMTILYKGTGSSGHDAMEDVVLKAL